MQISKLLGKKFNQESNKPTNQRESSGGDSKLTNSLKISDFDKTSTSEKSNFDSKAAKPFPKSFRSQSAMEYLMTYGWAILIIAVVLVALFQMGVFNSANFAPKAQPGACQVFKTTASTSLEGICNNMLPQYVAQFNGASSYVSTGTTELPAGSAARSVFGWVYITGSAYFQVFYGYGTVTATNEATFGILSGELDVEGDSERFTSSLTPSNNAWHFVGYTYTAGSNSITFYLDGQTPQVVNDLVLNTIISGTNPSTIGAYPSLLSNPFNGLISNVQIYNTSLSANDVQALYQEGIGGAPQNTQNLVGWWPLNGNANDYSGNNNNGAATSVIYSGSWENGYSAP